MSIVVSIFDKAGSLKPIVDAMKSDGIDTNRLRVLTYDDVPTELASDDFDIVWIGDVERALNPGDMGTGGTGLPGATSKSPDQVHGDELLESLSELGIPDGRTDHYANAVEGGKLLIGYPNPPDPAALRQMLTSLGATTVEEF